MEKYKLLGLLGRGNRDSVYKCRDIRDNSTVAIKLIKYDSKDEGVPCSAIREISVLKELKHDNVVGVLDVFDAESGFYLVSELMRFDLSTFIRGTSNELDLLLIKSFVYQMLQGLSYCHSQKVIHRDLKPQNLLIDAGGTVKIDGFGLSRTIEVPLPQYTIGVATSLGYTAPEIMLCAPYSSAVDIWSVGCVFAEMVRKKVLFGGRQRKAVMSKIISMFGWPDEKDWPGVTTACLNLFETEKLPSLTPALDLAASVPRLETQGLDLLSKLLCMNPNGRITAHDALKHPYFNDLDLNP